MTSPDDKLERVLASLHDAMLDDALWPATSALIDEACGLKGSALVVGSGHSQADGQIFLTRFCFRGERREDGERWYFEHYFARDERVPRLARLPDSRLVHITDLYRPHELRTSAAYNEALLRGEFQNGLNVRLDGPEQSSIIWNLTDSIERDGWGSVQIEMLRSLLPHVRQFVRVRQALVAAEALGASLAALLDNTSIGIIYLDRRGRIVEANDRARRILRQGGGLLDRGGFLRARFQADNVRLEELLARALPTFERQGVSESMTARRSSDLPRLAVHVSPVGGPHMNFGISRVAALVLVVEPGRQPHIDPEVVAAALDLTPAETQVAVSMAAGSGVRDIAISTGRRADSVRFHLKQIYGKHGISRQADLVRLVLSLAGVSDFRR